MVHPSKITQKKIKAAFLSAYGIDLENYKLSFRDIEDDIIEIRDNFDFEYMINQHKQKEGNIHIYGTPVDDTREEDQRALDEEKSISVILENSDALNSLLKKEFKRKIRLENEKLKKAEEIINKSENYGYKHEIKRDTNELINEEYERKYDILSSKIDEIACMLENNLKTSKDGLKKHIPPKTNDKTSEDISAKNEHIHCNSCKKYEFTGIRFKCLTCDDYDLCESCEKRNKHLHPMIRINSPLDKLTMDAIYKIYKLQQKTSSDNRPETKIEFLKQLTSGRFSDDFYTEFVSQYTAISLDRFQNEMIKLFK